MNPMLLKNATEDELDQLRQLTAQPGSKIRYLAFARKAAGVHYVFAHSPDHQHSAKQWRLRINPRLASTGEEVEEISAAIEIAKAMDGFEQFGTVHAKHLSKSVTRIVEPATTILPIRGSVVRPFKVKSVSFTSSFFSTPGLVTRIVEPLQGIDPVQYCQARYGHASPTQLALVRDSFADEARRLLVQTTGKHKRSAGSQADI